MQSFDDSRSDGRLDLGLLLRLGSSHIEPLSRFLVSTRSQMWFVNVDKQNSYYGSALSTESLAETVDDSLCSELSDRE